MGLKYQINSDFFNKWSKEMAYILGYLYADGSLEDASYIRGKYVRVSSVDLLTIKNIKKILKSKHKIVKLLPKKVNHKPRYLIRIGSKKIYDSLTSLGLFPNKSLTVSYPKVNKLYLSDFVRGYFDGDGCVFLEIAKGIKQKFIIKKLTTIFTSGSRAFLVGLRDSLHKEVGVTFRKIYTSQRSFQLRYSTKDSIALFAFLYHNTPRKLYLKRKYLIFTKYFRLKGNKFDKSIDKILNKLS